MKSLKGLTISTTIVFVCMIIVAGASGREKTPSSQLQVKTYMIDRTVSKEAKNCIDCHTKVSAGLVADWAASRHAHVNVTCLDCHSAGPADSDISKVHLEIDSTPISVIVSPRDCSRCHPSEAAEYSVSKHANTLEIIWKIDPWMNHGMNNDIERVTGCYHCHGSVVKIENGDFDPSTWPNVGVGRINPDGSRGSCSSCHTRHKFSLEQFKFSYISIHRTQTILLHR